MTKESNVIPFDKNTWQIMLMLKGSLEIMKERNNDGRFNNGIKRETELLKRYIKEYKEYEEDI